MPMMRRLGIVMLIFGLGVRATPHSRRINIFHQTTRSFNPKKRKGSSVLGSKEDDTSHRDKVEAHSSIIRGAACTLFKRCTFTRANGDNDEIVLCSVRAKSKIWGISKFRPPRVNISKECRDHEIEGGSSNDIANQEEGKPSLNILKSLTEPLIPRSAWSCLTGREFFAPCCLPMLIKTGIKTATSSVDIIVWKPDKHTKKLLEASEDGALKNALTNGDILVWTGRFNADGYGSELPLVKTTWTLNMAPKAFTELLMDSSRVRSYNKMSLGRSDVVKFQEGIDSTSEEKGNGEAKIVRNLTKPPLSKRNMEFVTFMHARRMLESDDVGIGILGGGTDGGYVMVSRAVGGNGWANGLLSYDRAGNEWGSEFTRSEILLGVNVIRAIPGQPGKSEVTAVTHCNSPSVPRALAGKVGVKGAVDFVKDIRSLCK